MYLNIMKHVIKYNNGNKNHLHYYYNYYVTALTLRNNCHPESRASGTTMIGVQQAGFNNRKV